MNKININYENIGKNIKKLYKIANVFNVSIDSIIEKTSEDKQKTNKKDLMLKEIWEVIKKYDNKL